MGGPGSGPQRRDDDDSPISEETLKLLYRGLRKRLVAGDPKAQVEFLVRLDEMRLLGKISSSQHRDLSRSAQPRQSVSLYVGAEERTRRLDHAAEVALKRRAAGAHLRDVGPPPDDLNTPDAGEPKAEKD